MSSVYVRKRRESKYEWGFPYGEQIVGTITVVDTFLGVILGISNAQYKNDNPEE